MERILEFLWQNFLGHWNVKTRRFQIFILLYLMLLISHLDWFWIKMPKKKRRSWVPLKIRETKTAEVVQRRLCSLWFSQKLDNGKQTLVSEVQYFLHSKSSYTGFNQATRKFRRMRAFARFKKEIWCMHLAFVDKLPKDNNGVKYLLVRQDMFDRTVDANKRFKRNR